MSFSQGLLYSRDISDPPFFNAFSIQVWLPPEPDSTGSTGEYEESTKPTLPSGDTRLSSQEYPVVGFDSKVTANVLPNGTFNVFPEWPAPQRLHACTDADAANAIAITAIMMPFIKQLYHRMAQ